MAAATKNTMVDWPFWGSYYQPTSIVRWDKGICNGSGIPRLTHHMAGCQRGWRHLPVGCFAQGRKPPERVAKSTDVAHQECQRRLSNGQVLEGWNPYLKEAPQLSFAVDIASLICSSSFWVETQLNQST